MDYIQGNTPGVVKSSYGAVGQTAPVRQTIAKPTKLAPETHPWWWNPFRCDVRFGPDDFRRRLKEIDPDLEVTWNPIRERWCIWAKAPRIQHPACSGWRLLFIQHGPDHEYLPLDERVFARIFQVDMTKQSAKEYVQRIADEYWRDEEKKRQRLHDEAIDMAMPFYDHGQIQVSMRGHSNGSKFSTYLA